MDTWEVTFEEHPQTEAQTTNRTTNSTNVGNIERIASVARENTGARSRVTRAT